MTCFVLKENESELKCLLISDVAVRPFNKVPYDEVSESDLIEKHVKAFCCPTS